MYSPLFMNTQRKNWNKYIITTYSNENLREEKEKNIYINGKISWKMNTDYTYTANKIKLKWKIACQKCSPVSKKKKKIIANFTPRLSHNDKKSSAQPLITKTSETL